MVHPSPRSKNLARSRWWLAGLQQAVPWLTTRSLPGIWQLLRRLRVAYKRGRRYVHSPDLAYASKVALIHKAEQSVRAEPKRFVLVYQDEVTYYRRPTVAQGYAPLTSDQPYARQGLRHNTSRRIATSLNLLTGQLFSWQRAHFDRATLIRYYQALAHHYPEAETIFVVQDNWPVHFHPDVLAAVRSIRVVLLALPTYAPWLNPVEKVWRKLYQEVLHLHEFADQWDQLQTVVTQWLEKFTDPAPDLLRYVGLPVNSVSELIC